VVQIREEITLTTPKVQGWRPRPLSVDGGRILTERGRAKASSLVSQGVSQKKSGRGANYSWPFDKNNKRGENIDMRKSGQHAQSKHRDKVRGGNHPFGLAKKRKRKKKRALTQATKEGFKKGVLGESRTPEEKGSSCSGLSPRKAKPNFENSWGGKIREE